MTPLGDSATNAFKALANPIRLRIFYSLAASGEATATLLGKELEMTPSAVSYHLAKMGELGLLEVVADGGRDGRERWWKLADGGVAADRDASGADALQFAVLCHHRDRLAAFLSANPSGANLDAAFSADMVLKLDPSMSDKFQQDLVALLRQYAAMPATDGTSTFVMVQGIPFEA